MLVVRTNMALSVLLFLLFLAGPIPALADLPMGHLDEAQPTWVGGWGFDPDHPEAEIAIHIYVDGQYAGNGETKGYRPDVNAMFGITGNHGFTFPVDIAQFGSGVHNVCAYGIDPDGQGNPAFDPCPYKVTISCNPSCAGKSCGDDGCGGSCGNCPAGHSCSNGQCMCQSNCGDTTWGHLDSGTQSMIGGWARDPDWDGPIQVHVYVDGAHVKVLTADAWREDVGAHGFSWVPPPFGQGKHEVVVHAIGVNSAGVPDGENPALPGSPQTMEASCDGLEFDALGWCQGVWPYWKQRQSDTVFVSNDSVRAGVNTSYGGTIFQLYGPGWDRNLVLEHGGGAMQLSIWGYDPVGGVGWYGTDSCDPAWYGSYDACLAAGHSGCSAWAHPGGAHTPDCVSAKPCGGWTPGAPWNPIQAQGPDCGWDSPGNNCNASSWNGGTFYTRLDAPFHFTSTQPPAPMPMEQWVTAHWGYLEIKYKLSYSGPYTWSPHPQEIPAFFTSAGMHQHFYWYGGDAPFTGDSVGYHAGPTGTYLRFPGQETYGHGEDYNGYVREGWWGVCDGPQERCVTVASFSPLMNEVALHVNQSGGSGYITALGYFGVHPGMSHEWTIYVFPYRYDQMAGDKTVREHIYDLAPESWKVPVCVASCQGKECGPDGCGGTCGTCEQGQACENGTCPTGVCEPNCGGKQCGPDGCANTCGACPPGLSCNDSGQCVSNCMGDCSDKQCGTDGCGQSCGECLPGHACAQGVCVADCTPDCFGKQCGSDGCGGVCGTCGFDMVCTWGGKCLPAQDVDPEDRWKPGEEPPVTSGQDDVSGTADAADAGPTISGQDNVTPTGPDADQPCPAGYAPDGAQCTPETLQKEVSTGCALTKRGGDSAALLLLLLVLCLLSPGRRCPKARVNTTR